MEAEATEEKYVRLFRVLRMIFGPIIKLELLQILNNEVLVRQRLLEDCDSIGITSSLLKTVISTCLSYESAQEGATSNQSADMTSIVSTDNNNNVSTLRTEDGDATENTALGDFDSEAEDSFVDDRRRKRSKKNRRRKEENISDTLIGVIIDLCFALVAKHPKSLEFDISFYDFVLYGHMCQWLSQSLRIEAWIRNILEPGDLANYPSIVSHFSRRTKVLSMLVFR